MECAIGIIGAIIVISMASYAFDNVSHGEDPPREGEANWNGCLAIALIGIVFALLGLASFFSNP